MKKKTVYVCSACGHETAKWMGKCPACGQWNTLEEMAVREEKNAFAPSANRLAPQPVPVCDIDLDSDKRVSTGIGEFDRVLGGGLVVGSLVLVAGEPGIGKSTLLLQACISDPWDFNGRKKRGNHYFYKENGRMDSNSYPG